ncbi:MAG: FliI/YscN family ATPase [Planctomycetaceae bacterium]|nr:FliI/YscN family ATPase [Planctomycetaceae bacterium]
MTPLLDVPELRDTAARTPAFQKTGRVTGANGLIQASLRAAVGECCQIQLPDGRSVSAEAVGFDGQSSLLMPYENDYRPEPGMQVQCTGMQRQVDVGPELLGRVLDGLGRPVDGQPQPKTRKTRSPHAPPPNSLLRQRIDQPLVTGQRAIDTLLTLGMGQRVGLFAGSGVGKSTLMGEIARHSNATVNVVALVGERGREVRPFIEDSLQAEGLARSVVVVATSDESPLMRINAVLTAIAIAEDYRDRGINVLFFLDSLTRMAMAQRELGILLGEHPVNRGYPPSVMSLMAQTLERLGTGSSGSITGIVTVLVDGDDMDEPIADAARSILDGHIVLKRELAAAGHFPAISVLDSVSRLFREVTDAPHQQATATVRELLASYAEMKDMIEIGAYQKGTVATVDQAIHFMPIIRHFLCQSVGESFTLQQSSQDLLLLGSAILQARQTSAGNSQGAAS